jgi:hypothetical protein
MDEPTQSVGPTAEVKRSRGLAGYAVWGFLVLVMVYLLSPGPVWRLFASRIKAGSPVPALRSIYWPWRYAYWHTPLHKPLGMYMHLFLPETYEEDGQIAFSTGIDKWLFP